MLYTHNVYPYTCNSTELHQQGVTPRSQYSDHAPEAVMLQQFAPIIVTSQWVTSTGHLYNHLFFPNNPARRNSLENTLETQYTQYYANNDNNYFIDVTNLGLHNKDFALVTQASILVIYIFHRDRM